MKKIAITTSSRADWGLLKPVVDKLNEPILIICGSHLSPEHGLTKNEIYNDGYGIHKDISREVEILLSSDTEKGACSAAGLTLIKFGELFDRIKPDLVLVLGDRFEVLASCMAAHIHRIPIAHIHGGDISGNTDNAFRHSITHMATYHFPATELAKNNIMRMRGFRPVFAPEMFGVYNVGALGCDGLVKRTKEPDNKYTVIVHPETLSKHLENGKTFYTKLNDLLEEMWEYDFFDSGKISPEMIWIMPNADNSRYEIADHICTGGYFSSKTMPRDEFIKELSKCKAIIGNSSCGIIEAPALGVPAINIGNRQAGRERAASIIDCEPNQESIKKALDKLESKNFQDLMKTDYYMPYKGENVAGKIVEILNNL